MAGGTPRREAELLARIAPGLWNAAIGQDILKERRKQMKINKDEAEAMALAVAAIEEFDALMFHLEAIASERDYEVILVHIEAIEEIHRNSVFYSEEDDTIVDMIKSGFGVFSIATDSYLAAIGPRSAM